MGASRDTSAERCVLQNPVFTRLGTVTFRRGESDGAPVMVVPLGESAAAIPLVSLQREFALADDSPDGRMLRLISESLNYVVALQVGDELPSEVLTGQASWDRRAWDGVFADWAAAAPVLDESTWPRLARTCQFLAPRFMPTQEWASVMGSRTAGRKPNPERLMHW